MSKLTFPSHPLLLGFDQMERLVERTARNGADGYPPFNIEVTGPHSFRITLALAGFREDDLSVTLEGRQLIIRGQQTDAGSEDRVFLHRGIAARQFQRVFALGDGVDVAKAALSDGLLHIDLKRHEPEETVQIIRIDRK
ncbi:MAG: Hsp20 family protein [Rhodobacteraceae bacterium]|nr:Hsp20 family protein [Paracoccaceae bacterium]